MSAFGRKRDPHLFGNLVGHGTKTLLAVLMGMSSPTKLFLKKSRQKRKGGRTRHQQAEVEYALARERVLFGTLGAASPVRKIDPDTGEVVALIDPNTRTTLPMDVKQTKTRAV